ncbi:hypothetical protein EA716_15495 [Acinetobacter baumannii]|uniref:hypothetical protein n=1 Tax=Acinetobacter baumannii TaxID=470 RepID=UPI000F738729|nr:hypothetical protein [Acinetobacter baumannii]RSP92646.1 hypothetical protein EA716_15495 [Acinetobacter baumannii]
MSQENSNDDLKWVDKLIQLGFDGDEVINSLVGNLVSYLAQKEIIDLDDYLKFTEESKNTYIQNLKDEGHSDDSDIVRHVNRQFSMHVNDFKGPE